MGVGQGWIASFAPATNQHLPLLSKRGKGVAYVHFRGACVRSWGEGGGGRRLWRARSVRLGGKSEACLYIVLFFSADWLAFFFI